MVGDVAAASVLVVVDVTVDPVIHLWVGSPGCVVHGDNGTYAALQDIGWQFVGEAMKEVAAIVGRLSSHFEGA